MKGQGVVAWALTPLIDELEQVQARLRSLAETLPPVEVAPAEAEDVALRDVLDCVLADRLEPALRELRRLTGEEE